MSRLRPYQSSGIVAKDHAEWRREYKRLVRRRAGAQLRSDIAAKAQAKRDEIAKTKALRVVNSPLHDAHVKRFHAVMKSRSYAKNKYETQPDVERQRSAQNKLNLANGYVVQNLVAMGVPRSKVTARLIELKREQMALRRLALELKRAARKITKERYESINKHT